MLLAPTRSTPAIVWVALATACVGALGCGAKTGLYVDEVEGRDGGMVVLDARAPGVACDRVLEISFTPTPRLQLAVWVGRSDGDRVETLALTEATARRGIGNRPGALQLNSGYRWPYGRRENVLPGWAQARLAAGARPFRRVIFHLNGSEGWLSNSGSGGPPYRDTEDDFFCLSFIVANSRRDGLDAVSCASQLHSDKGRFLTSEDLAAGYAEPEQSSPGIGSMRSLSTQSAYPPRRDVSAAIGDHPDVASYVTDATSAMPELDAVTMATPPGGSAVSLTWAVPVDWPDDHVAVAVEASREGDYNDAFDTTRFPTPSAPTGMWDTWSQTYGYPYRGQPSVIFDLDAALPPTDRDAPEVVTTTRAPSRMGVLDGSLRTTSIDTSISDDPLRAAGSGADRLTVNEGTRVRVVARQTSCVRR